MQAGDYVIGITNNYTYTNMNMLLGKVVKTIGYNEILIKILILKNGKTNLNQEYVVSKSHFCIVDFE